jgi:hypothetical protein
LFHYYDTVANQANVLIPNATVKVFVAGTQTLAPLFVDDGITPGPNPIFTNNLGVFNFFVADGRYDLQVSGNNISSFTQQNVEISDITQAGPGTGDLAWQTDNLEVAELALANIPGTPPTGFMSVYGKLSPKHLFVKDDTGVETDLFSSVGTGAQPPLNSLQYDNAGSLAGSQFIYNPSDNTDLICSAPCVTLTVVGQNSGLQLASPSGNNFINMAAEDLDDGANLVVQSLVTSPATVTTGQASFSYIGGNSLGGSCFDTTGSLGSSNPCSQGYVAYPADIGTETINGQDLLGFLSSPLLNKGAGQTVGTVANFVVNTPVQQDALGAFVPVVENTTNSYGLLVQDLGGFSTVDAAAIKITAQTPPSSGTQYAIEALPGSGINLLSDGVDLAEEFTPALPPTGRLRLYGDSLSGDLKCLDSLGGNCLPEPVSSGTVTSVGLALPPQFVVSGTPVTGAGTLTATLANEIPNTVFAGPGLNSVGGIFDGVTANNAGGFSQSLSITPDSTQDWAFFLTQASTFLSQPSGVSLTGSGSWTTILTSGNQGGLFSQVLSSNSTLNATANLGNSTNWASMLFLLTTNGSGPAVLQRGTLSGGISPGSSIATPGTVTAGNSLLVVLLGAPSNLNFHVSSFVWDNLGNIYTPIANQQNISSLGGGDQGEVVVAWLANNVIGGAPATITWGTGTTNGVSGTLSVMEVSNLAPATAQPTFRYLQRGDVAAANLLPVETFSQIVLNGNTPVGANSPATLLSLPVTMPLTGGPFRAFINYSLYVSTGGSGVGFAFWVSDGSRVMATTNMGQSAGSTGLVSASYGGWSPSTYLNGQSVTFTLGTEGDHSYTVLAAPTIGPGGNSSFQVVMASSN